MSKIGVGIVGCGNISGIYLSNITEMFDNVYLAGVCDLDQAKASAAAEKYHTKAMALEEMLSRDEIRIVVNLTTPAGHYPICKQILEAGKNAYVEKPLSLSFEEGKELVALAAEKNLLIGCAPDTFMGAGIQTAARAINDGLIGDIIGASAFMMCHGHEGWHPDPEFYYKKGGGPMFDMGPYYLTALVTLIGSVKEVNGMTSISFPSRTIGSEPKRGTVIDVEVPTHVCGMLRFENNAIGNIVTSFDIWGHNLPCIEIYGTRGSISVPDPNGFGGEVKVRQYFSDRFETIPLATKHSMNCRGYGVSDMAGCLLAGRTDLRADGKKALHVLEIMHAIHTSSDTGRTVELTTRCEKPRLLEL